MNDRNDDGLTRRQALAAAAAAALTAALPGCTQDTHRPHPEVRTMTAHTHRLPVAYLPHGGGPWPFVDLGMGAPAELDALATYLRSLKSLAPTKPRAVVMISAHWEEPQPTVMTSPRPPMLYDYYGFPEEAYRITWPAPGHPEVAARVRELLGAAGLPSGASADRGFDHGTFVPMKLTWPDADMPTVQLSLKEGLDPAEHLAIGRALAPLRDEGVLLLGSGMSFHNMRAFRQDRAQVQSMSGTFDNWLAETTALDPAERDRRLTAWASAPGARLAHPREEHLLPLMVIAGAAGADRGRVAYQGSVMNARISAHHFG
jgi:aromatic ring-opening dioxygenase catalytic subunit (LigB family)